MIFSLKKKKMEIWYFIQMPRKVIFPHTKKSCWNMIFLVLSGKIVFFSENMMFFLWTENERWSFPRETWKYDIFCIYAQMLQIWYYASAKKSEMIFSQKNSLKGDWHSRSHSRKSSNDSLYFYGHIHRSFHILLPVKKPQET